MQEKSALPTVAIVILNWNGLEDTCECLESLQSVTFPAFDTIVIDNGSRGDDAAVLQEKFGDSIHLIRNEKNYGFAGGCNIGIRFALSRGADYVLLLNNDTIVDPAFLTSLVEAAQTLPDGAAFCPKICHYDRPRVLHSTGGRVNPWTGVARQVGRDLPDDGRLDRIQQRDYADGACMLIRRSALETVGLLDEEYFAYWEETDWCARAAKSGLACYYIPTARIWHRGSRSLTDQGRRQFLFRRNAFLFLRKRKRAYHLATAILYHVFVLAPLYLLRHPAAWGRLFTEARALLWHATNRTRRQEASLASTAPLGGPEEEPGP